MEERLGQLEAPGWRGQLGVRNPLVRHAAEELASHRPWTEEVIDAAEALGVALGLDRPDAPQIGIRVAASVLDQVLAMSSDEVSQGIASFGVRDPMLALVSQALSGSRLDGTPREPHELAAVERSLYLVTSMVRAQEEVEELEMRLAGEVKR